MIKQLLAKNKIVQRVKAVKDLFLEKLDSLSHVQFDQLQKLEKLEKLEKLNQLDPLDFKVEQLNNSTEQIRQENAETKRKADLSLQNQAFLLKFSVDIIKNIRILTEKLQTNYSQSQKQRDLILDSFQRIYEAYQQQSDAIYQTFQAFQEETRERFQLNQQLLSKVYEDIHNYKFKVVTNQSNFQGIGWCKSTAR